VGGHRIHCAQDWLRRYRGARGQGAAPGQRDPQAAQCFFCPSGARPPTQVLSDFIDQHRDTFGVEPICKVLQIAPSGYRRLDTQQRNPDLRCARAKLDDTLKPEIPRVWQANMRVYRASKVYKQMKRERITVAHCAVERLMKCLSLQGVKRGKVVRTTVSDMTAARPLDRVNRQFKADRPNQLWVSDFTYVSTWQGWQYQALYDRQPKRTDALIHHCDRVSQYVSIRYSERLAEAGIDPSVGSKGDSYDNALAETNNGL
jgi:putative transposase